MLNFVIKDGRTTERLIQIDICGIIESRERGERDQIGWIPVGPNPADDLTI